MYLSDFDWGAVSSLVTKGIDTAAQIQAQRFDQKMKMMQAQRDYDQASMARQMQQMTPVGSRAAYSGEGRFSGINPIYLIGGAGALLLFLLLRK